MIARQAGGKAVAIGRDLFAIDKPDEKRPFVGIGKLGSVGVFPKILIREGSKKLLHFVKHRD
jgi:hypothetical protein